MRVKIEIGEGIECAYEINPLCFSLLLAVAALACGRDAAAWLDKLVKMNQVEYQRSGDRETLTRIAQYELAYRRQISVPAVMNNSKAPQHIQCSRENRLQNFPLV